MAATFVVGSALVGGLVGEAYNMDTRVALAMKEILRRLDFLEFSEYDAELLRAVHVFVEQLHVDDLFADIFYEHLGATPELRKFIPDEQTIEHLKRLQVRYFNRLTGGVYDGKYVEDRLRVGYVHQRIGLEPKWYTGAYRKYLSFLLRSIGEFFGDDQETFQATYDALLKVIFFDMELALDTYFQRDREELMRVASHDALTGLPNRNLLRDRVERAIHRSSRCHGRFAVLFLDLDRFKNINDSLGHPVGDYVIKVVAERLQAALREGDTVARLGGDEFVILLLDVEHEESVASVVEKLIYTIERKIACEGRELLVSASIGVAFYPADGRTEAELLENADTAMYQAKLEAGGDSSYITRK